MTPFLFLYGTILCEGFTIAFGLLLSLPQQMVKANCQAPPLTVFNLGSRGTFLVNVPTPPAAPPQVLHISFFLLRRSLRSLFYYSYLVLIFPLLPSFPGPASMHESAFLFSVFCRGFGCFHDLLLLLSLVSFNSGWNGLTELRCRLHLRPFIPYHPTPARCTSTKSLLLSRAFPTVLSLN